MQNKFDRVEQLVSEWKALQPIEVEARKKLDKKFRLEFNYNSNHLEGNTLTYGETELLLFSGDIYRPHSVRELDEMREHDVAWRMVEEWANDKERPLTEQAIKNLNEVILVRPFWKEAITPDGQPTRREIKIGTYKQYPNSVRLANGQVFEYASPIETPAMMQELIDWFRVEEASGLHPITLAAMFHYKLVRIHPFDDGNGRIARLLMNYVLLLNDLPPVIIKSTDKQAYLRVLHIADIGDYEPFISYVAEQLEWSLQISIKAAKGESIEEENDWQKKLRLLKNKIGTSEQVTIKKGAEAYTLALKNIILPFLSSWETNLENIDPLFNSRKCQILLNNQEAGVEDKDLISALKRCFDEKGISLLSLKNNEIINMRVSVSFFDLRTAKVKAGFNGGEATIDFFENAVSIITVTGKTLSKLYSEALRENEAESLTNDLGSWFMSHLEEFIATQK